MLRNINKTIEAENTEFRIAQSMFYYNNQVKLYNFKKGVTLKSKKVSIQMKKIKKQTHKIHLINWYSQINFKRQDKLKMKY